MGNSRVRRNSCNHTSYSDRRNHRSNYKVRQVQLRSKAVNSLFSFFLLFEQDLPAGIEKWGLRRDLNPPQAVSAEKFLEKPATAAYTDQAILRRPPENLQRVQYIIVRSFAWEDADANGFNTRMFEPPC